MAQPEFSTSPTYVSETFNLLGKAWAERTISEANKILGNHSNESEELRRKRLEGLAVRCVSEGNPVGIPLLLVVGRFGQGAFGFDLERIKAAPEGEELIRKAEQFAQNGGRIIFPCPDSPAVSYHYIRKPNMRKINPQDPDNKTVIRQMLFSRIEGRGPILEMPDANSMASAMIQPRSPQP